LTVSRTKVFKRDYKRIIKRGWDTNKLDDIIKVLATGGHLDPKQYDHPLQGK